MSDEKNIFKKISVNPPKHIFSTPLMVERGKMDLPPGTKGGEKMKPDPNETERQQAFDCFCKKVLKNEAANGHREINYRASMEVSMSDLPEEALEQIAVYDKFPWDFNEFRVGNDIVLIESDRLSEALEAIPEKDRNILLMYFFLDMADREIADRIGIARRTVNDRRQSAIRLLQKLMGGEADE